jgi:hypothetical protein
MEKVDLSNSNTKHMVIRKSRILVFAQWSLGRKHSGPSYEPILETHITDHQAAF